MVGQSYMFDQTGLEHDILKTTGQIIVKFGSVNTLKGPNSFPMVKNCKLSVHH